MNIRPKGCLGTFDNLQDLKDKWILTADNKTFPESKNEKQEPNFTLQYQEYFEILVFQVFPHHF